MKIIEPGQPTEEWWIGRRGTCPICGAVVEIEQGDGVFLLARIGTPGEVFDVYADCPNQHPGRVRAIRLRREDAPDA